MRQKPIPPLRLRNHPILTNSDRQILRPHLIHQPLHLLLILLAVECASAINQHPTRFQHLPSRLQNLTTPFHAHPHILRAPLRSCALILAKHPLARARRIHQYRIKFHLQFLKMSRRIICHQPIWRAPFRHILHKHMRPLRHILVRHQEPLSRQILSNQCRLPTRRGTHIQHHSILSHILLQRLPHKHRRRLLHIIRPRMKHRVIRKPRSLRQIPSPLTPLHSQTTIICYL